MTRSVEIASYPHKMNVAPDPYASVDAVAMNPVRPNPGAIVQDSPNSADY